MEDSLDETWVGGDHEGKVSVCVEPRPEGPRGGKGAWHKNQTANQRPEAAAKNQGGTLMEAPLNYSRRRFCAKPETKTSNQQVVVEVVWAK